MKNEDEAFKKVKEKYRRIKVACAHFDEERETPLFSLKSARIWLDNFKIEMDKVVAELEDEISSRGEEFDQTLVELESVVEFYKDYKKAEKAGKNDAWYYKAAVAMGLHDLSKLFPYEGGECDCDYDYTKELEPFDNE